MDTAQTIVCIGDINTYTQPEKQLWAAVIQQQIVDFHSVGKGAAAKKIRNSARAWLFESPRASPGSLLWICDHLNLDPSYIRLMAKKYQITGYSRGATKTWEKRHNKIKGEKNV